MWCILKIFLCSSFLIVWEAGILFRYHFIQNKYVIDFLFNHENSCCDNSGYDFSGYNIRQSKQNEEELTLLSISHKQATNVTIAIFMIK